MATTISKLYPTGVLQVAAELDETLLQTPSGSAKFTAASSTRLSVAANSAFTFGTNNHTIEFWMYQINRELYATAWTYGNGYSLFSANAYYFNCGTSQFQVIIGNGSAYQTTTNLTANPPSLNVWHHYAIVRNSANLTLYVDGTNQGTVNISTRDITAQPGAMLIGSSGTTPGSINGYISNFRILNGTALYTSDFTPPTVPPTAIANTKLLLSQANSASLLKDSSSNNFTVSNINTVTYNSLTPIYFPMMRTSTSGVYALQFDEINLDSSVAERKNSDGTYQVSGYFDDYTLTSGPAPTPLVPGPQFNLFAAPSSGNTWTDVTGNYHATLQGSPTYVSNNGGGIKLNNATYGGNDYISVPYNISSNTVTVEIVASFNPTSFWATIWGNESYTAGRGYMAYMTSATSITYGKPLGPAAETITSSNAIRHWVFVINGTQQKLYLNGTQVGTTKTVTNQTLFASSQILFGARHNNDGTGATDKLNSSTTANQPVFYQMRLYNKAFSDSEVTQNYNSVKSTYGI